jgi:hypothetical protein
LLTALFFIAGVMSDDKNSYGSKKILAVSARKTKANTKSSATATSAVNA